MRSGVWRRLRPAVAAVAVALVVPLLAPVGSDAGGSTQKALTVLEASTIQSINAVRVAHGVMPLQPSPGLFASAMVHCREMVAGGYFAHNDPGRETFQARLADFYPQGQHLFYMVGENLLWTLAPMTSDGMVAKWMKSPEHRWNLLDPAWRQIAVAVLSVPSAPGVYEGFPVTVVTVDFGVRR
jgi:uncharacterized protein YkwD